MSVQETIAGLILSGGRATRMGGGDKTLRPLGDGTILSHVISRLAPQAGSMAISANGDPARLAGFGLPVIADTAGAGPLAGILAGMDWARPVASHILTVAGDTPFFPANLCEKLDAARKGDAGRIAVACSDGEQHPTFALWPVTLHDELLVFLGGQHKFRVRAFIESHDFVEVDFPMLDLTAKIVDPFFNINTPGDLQEAEAIVRAMI
ncbi:molybdenum cofactor guanylyltransferase [Mesorhizobium sp. YR577]|nr:molybdenum cofactor guanylyltransferase [Mesorhizobium sp. YR577]